MKSDRFLTGILIGIGVLVVAALVLFFVRQGGSTYLGDDTPVGVTHNFILALIKADYEQAYSYMAESPVKPGLPGFRTSFLNSRQNFSDYSAQVGEVDVSGDTANVAVTLIFNSGNPFSGANRQQQTAQLERQNGAWKVWQMPYPFWDFNWGSSPGKESPLPAYPAPSAPGP